MNTLDEFIKFQKAILQDAMGSFYKEENFGKGIELIIRETAKATVAYINDIALLPIDNREHDFARGAKHGWNDAKKYIDRKAKDFLGEK